MTTTGVVLAGGLSSRMHSDKSRLFWNGMSLLEHTCQLLSDAGCSDVIVSSNRSSHHIKDRYQKAGPLAGIDACLNYLRNRYNNVRTMLIMPVDMPLMSVDLLQQLRTQSEEDRITYYNLGRFPLMLPVNEQLAKQLNDALEKHQSGAAVSVYRFLSHFDCQVLTIDKDQERAFINCNTPEQWQDLINTT